MLLAAGPASDSMLFLSSPQAPQRTHREDE